LAWYASPYAFYGDGAIHLRGIGPGHRRREESRRLHPITLAVGSSASAEGDTLEKLWRDGATSPGRGDISTKFVPPGTCRDDDGASHFSTAVILEKERTFCHVFFSGP